MQDGLRCVALYCGVICRPTIVLYQEIQTGPLIQLTRTNARRRPLNSLQFTPSAWDWRQQGAISAVHNQGKISDSISIVAEGSFFFI